MGDKTEYPIKKDCLDFFVTRDMYHAFLKIAVPLAGLFVPAVVAYGFLNSGEVISQGSKIAIIENNQHRLDSAVDAKLDTLIKRGNK
jgi:hypothetical protein